MGVVRNYVKLIETQLAVIETRLEGTVGSESEDLRIVLYKITIVFVELVLKVSLPSYNIILTLYIE